LKKLATDPQYTYDNFVTSNDVEALFSNATGKSLKSFFDFYLKTTQTIDFTVKETGYQQYQVKIANHFMDLPVEILLDNELKRIVIPQQGIVLRSKMPPTIDPNGYYLKKVTIQ
jgi:hypothetical protein